MIASEILKSTNPVRIDLAFSRRSAVNTRLSVGFRPEAVIGGVGELELTDTTRVLPLVRLARAVMRMAWAGKCQCVQHEKIQAIDHLRAQACGLTTKGIRSMKSVFSVKTIAIIGFLSLAVAFNANAHDSDRVDQLEKELQETKIRLSKLESLLGNPSNAQKPVASGEGWKSVMNWRKLANDMSTSDVQRILGEPHRLDGGLIADWYYQNGGRITFFGEKIQSWQEPRR